MKITVSQLRRIIREEVERATLNEAAVSRNQKDKFLDDNDVDLDDFTPVRSLAALQKATGLVYFFDGETLYIKQEGDPNPGRYKWVSRGIMGNWQPLDDMGPSFGGVFYEETGEILDAAGIESIPPAYLKYIDF